MTIYNIIESSKYRKMKNLKVLFIMLLVSFLGSTILIAQQPKVNFFRPPTQDGLNVFEVKKDADIGTFEGVKVRIGGNFAQQYQAFNHENNADPSMGSIGTEEIDLNQLYALGSGFNLATANLNLDVQLDDGIRLAVESYMSSRHHEEFWVKGGYIQIDKLPFLENSNWFDDNFRVKIGHFQVNYGDQQFRRSDNGNAMFNPFVGNYIMDAFATEIGGEIYAFPSKNLIAMVGMTNGLIKGDISEGQRSPSVYGKLAYDAQVNDDLRLRLSGSIYANGNTPRNTLYGGDRAGSRYYMVMEGAYSRGRSGAISASSPGSQFTSGRINPGLSNEITAFQINPFVKFKGLEFFGTFETASGKASFESEKRTVTQVSGELIYRFLPKEQMYIGGRMNSVSGDLSTSVTDISVNRLEMTYGWFPTRNLLLKLSYVDQHYNDFPTANRFHEGLFNGMIVEAVVGF